MFKKPGVNSIDHFLNKQGTGYEYLKSIELKNGDRPSLKSIEILVTLPILRIIGLKPKARYTFKSR